MATRGKFLHGDFLFCQIKKVVENKKIREKPAHEGNNKQKRRPAAFSVDGCNKWKGISHLTKKKKRTNGRIKRRLKAKGLGFYVECWKGMIERVVTVSRNAPIWLRTTSPFPSGLSHRQVDYKKLAPQFTASMAPLLATYIFISINRVYAVYICSLVQIKNGERYSRYLNGRVTKGKQEITTLECSQASELGRLCCVFPPLWRIDKKKYYLCCCVYGHWTKTRRETGFLKKFSLVVLIHRCPICSSFL